jgi:uncharacterized protein
MEWKGKRESENVDDARSRSSGGGVARGGGGLGLLVIIGRKFGIKGILAAVVLAFVLLKLGIVDLNTLLGGASPMNNTHRFASGFLALVWTPTGRSSPV